MNKKILVGCVSHPPQDQVICLFAGLLDDPDRAHSLVLKVRVIYYHSKINVVQSNRIFKLKSFVGVHDITTHPVGHLNHCCC
jgi:hypothetical protein